MIARPKRCGGTPGYTRLLEALVDPSHPDHRHLLEWVGAPIDPAALDLAVVNARLQHVR
jgi:Plasmid pRiA4b ORF-3-like protein